MIKTFLLAVAGAMLGLLVAFVAINGVEVFGNVVHPFPADFGGTHDEMCRHVARYPAWVLAAVVPLWGLAALAATWVAQKIGNLYSAGFVGLLLLSGLIFNLSMLPYPAWFKVAILLAIPAALVAGTRLAARRKTVETGYRI